MIESGLRGRVELIQGVLIEKMPKSFLHRRIVESLMEFLRGKFGGSYYISQEQPLTLPDSEPEPDVAVMKGKRSDYSSHPKTAEWVLEVATADADYDREKAPLYAAAGIAEYWILIVKDARVEIYAKPSSGVYTRITSRSFQDALEMPPGGTVTLDAILGQGD